MKQKIKTKKAVSKRFRITGTGKILRRRQNLRHLRSNKSSSLKRRQHRMAQVKGAYINKIKKMIG